MSDCKQSRLRQDIDSILQKPPGYTQVIYAGLHAGARLKPECSKNQQLNTGSPACYGLGPFRVS